MRCLCLISLLVCTPVMACTAEVFSCGGYPFDAPLAALAILIYTLSVKKWATSRLYV